MSEDGDEQGFILVSCGSKQAKLWMDRFLCPGIHQLCIEAEGQMMTPKAFCIMGEKERLKDWKNAIRINGKSIRKQMDSGQLDFYKHDEICTGRCMSRNSKYDVKMEQLAHENKKIDHSEWPSLVPYTSSLDGPAYNILRNVSRDSPGCNSPNESVGHVVFPGMNLEETSPANVPVDMVIKQEKLSDTEDKESGVQVSNIPPMPYSIPACPGSNGSISGSSQPTKHRRKNALPKQLTANGWNDSSSASSTSSRQSKLETSCNSDGSHDTRIMEMVSEFSDTETLLEDSVSFWQSIKEIGLLENIIRDSKHALENLKNDMLHQGIQENDARKLSDVVTSLGLVTKIKWRMAEQRSHTESEKEKLKQEIQSLKRKVIESEEKHKMLDHKTECFESMIEVSRQKRLKLATPSSTTSGLCDEDDTSHDKSDA